MLRTILTISLTFIFHSAFSQELFKNECLSVRNCHKDSRFMTEVNQKISMIQSDTMFVFSSYGGVGCNTTDLILVYRKNNKSHIGYFKNENLNKNIKLHKKDTRLLNSFFEEKPYLTTDTTVKSYFYIDDGSSFKVMYSIGEQCGTYLFGPAYNDENPVQIWADKVRLMCWKYKSTN